MIKMATRSEVKDALKWFRLGNMLKVAHEPYARWQRGAIGDYQEGRKVLFTQGLFEESATPKERLGTKRELDDGRIFRYVGITAAAITASGTLLSKVQTPVDATIAAADAAIDLIGVRDITLTIAGATADLYKDGELVVKAGTDIGTKYKVSGNVVTGNPAAGRAWVRLYDKLFVTWVAASTTIAAHQNPFKDLLINPAVAGADATTQETVMGMAVRPITASYYAWVQSRGLAGLVLDIDAAAGGEANEMLIYSGTTAGRGIVIENTETTFFNGMQIIGHTLESADLTDTEGNLVFLTIE